jgi:hypothetical protein
MLLERPDTRRGDALPQQQAALSRGHGKKAGQQRVLGQPDHILAGNDHGHAGEVRGTI